MKIRAQFKINNREYVIIASQPEEVVREFRKALSENLSQDRKNYIPP